MCPAEQEKEKQNPVVVEIVEGVRVGVGVEGGVEQ